MKKVNAFIPIIVLVMGMSPLCSCQSEKNVPVVGTLTAYYAKEDFSADELEYKKGQLICDSNDPMNRIVEENTDNYKYEGNDGGEGYSWLLPKSKVEKKTYTMNQLTASAIGDKAYFVADDGCVARIFWSNSNGHGYFNWNGEEEKYRDEERYKECYVLSVEFISPYNNEKGFFEEQLEEKQGCIELYCKNRFAGEGSDSTDCRYREGLIGFIEEIWLPREGWGYDKTSYDENGKLLVDQWEADGISDYISIAYIAELDALYVDGRLYYRNSDYVMRNTLQKNEEIDAIPENNSQEQSQSQDIQHFSGVFFYNYFRGDTNAKMYFKLILKSDGTFTLEPSNEETKNWIDIDKVMSGSDYPEGGDWKVKETPVGKGAFLDFDGDWGEGTITNDRKVLEISNMNGYKLKTELQYETP